MFLKRVILAWFRCSRGRVNVFVMNLPEAFEKCPKCGAGLDAGFCSRSSGLSFVAPQKLDHGAFLDEDLTGAGLRKLLPSKAEFYRSYVCRTCELYVVDFSQFLDREQASELATSMTVSGMS